MKGGTRLSIIEMIILESIVNGFKIINFNIESSEMSFALDVADILPRFRSMVSHAWIIPFLFPIIQLLTTKEEDISVRFAGLQKVSLTHSKVLIY